MARVSYGRRVALRRGIERTRRGQRTGTTARWVSPKWSPWSRDPHHGWPRRVGTTRCSLNGGARDRSPLQVDAVRRSYDEPPTLCPQRRARTRPVELVRVESQEPGWRRGGAGSRALAPLAALRSSARFSGCRGFRPIHTHSPGRARPVQGSQRRFGGRRGVFWARVHLAPRPLTPSHSGFVP